MSTSKVQRLQLVGSGFAFVADGRSTAEESISTKGGSTIAALKQSVVWTREMPGIIRGLIRLGWPFKWHMAAIFAMNLVIASWETCLALVVAATITALSPESLQGPFFIIAIGLAYPVIVFQSPTEVLLPFVRDLYAVRYLRPHMEKGVDSEGDPLG